MKTSNANIGWYFYRELFNNYLGTVAKIDNENHTKKYDWKFLHLPKNHSDRKPAEKNNTALMKQKTDELLQLKQLVPKDYLNLNLNSQNTFCLKTTYPGLLTGSGYEHETGITGEFKLGFFFDHTTGLPVIPGPSIKGVLRSAFNHPDYIKELLNDKVFHKKNALITEQINSLNIQTLENEIFENTYKKNGKETQLTPYERDIFHDAFIEKSEFIGKGNAQNPEKSILGNDYITPHIDTENPALTPFKEPTPLQFLKVLPNVIFRFQFELHDSKTYTFIQAKHKKKLFKAILLDFGVGAKTNVGYGQFDPVNDK